LVYWRETQLDLLLVTTTKIRGVDTVILSSSICGLNSSGNKEETRGEIFVFIIKKINAESTCHCDMISEVKCGVVWSSISDRSLIE
jgi:hypothetical protein